MEPGASGLSVGTVLAFGPSRIRSELAARIAAKNPHLYAKDVEAVVDAILGRIAAALAAGDRVERCAFGTFCVRDREPRAGRNPRTVDILPALKGGNPYRMSGREGRTHLGGFLGRLPHGRSVSAG